MDDAKSQQNNGGNFAMNGSDEKADDHSAVETTGTATSFNDATPNGFDEGITASSSLPTPEVDSAFDADVVAAAISHDILAPMSPSTMQIDNNNDNTIEIHEETPRESVVGITSAAANTTAVFNKLTTWRQKANENAALLWSQQQQQTTTGNSSSWKWQSLRAAKLESPPKTPKVNLDEAKAAATTPPPLKNNGSHDSSREVASSLISRSFSSDASSSVSSSSNDASEANSEDYNRDSKPRSTSNAFSAAATKEHNSRILKWAAASSFVESMQSPSGPLFRGRYSFHRNFSTTSSKNGDSVNTAPLPPVITQDAPPSTPSQTARILSSPQATHLQQLMQKLQPHEYIMLLGRGLWGVHLKQCYGSSGGVYVDDLVQGGAAEKSGVVRIGDLLETVGDKGVSRDTLVTIPAFIAQSPRPVHLTLATGQIKKETRINYIDVCVALLYSVAGKQNDGQDETKQDGVAEVVKSNSRDSAKSDQKSANDESVATMELVQPTSFDQSSNVDERDRLLAMPVPACSPTDVCIRPPPVSVQRACTSIACQRNQDVKVNSDDILTYENIQSALEQALLFCVLDGRRFLFLSRHLSKINDDSTNAGAMLMLLLELVNFVDYYDLTPRRLQVANRLAKKFFLPTKVGKDLIPPMLDFHSVVSDTSLRQLESVLKTSTESTVPKDIFVDFYQAIVQQLSQHAFLSFVTSHECSRMRGYLQNVAPFINVDIATALRTCKNDSRARHYVTFILIFLLCQTDKDADDEAIDGSIKPVRQEDAATGLCAALHIWHGGLNNGDVISATELLWESFGALEQAPLSTTSRACLEELRPLLEKTSMDVDTTTDDWRQSAEQYLMDESKDIVGKVKKLADELVYDYITHYHAKFREHRFHEWLCIEYEKDRTEDGSVMPTLPQGSIKRMLRKIELPSGLSAHKQTHSSPKKVATEKSNTNVHDTNSECVVVFGSSMSPGGSDGDDNYIIRRYLAQSLGSGNDGDEYLQPEEVPPQLESYAIMPPTRRKPFANVTQDLFVSKDGWEVSLTDFIIPRAESSSDDTFETSLYGVSLVFQRSSSRSVDTSKVYTSRVEYSEGLPPDMPTVSIEKEESDQKSTVIQIKLGVDVPKFADKLSNTDWSESEAASQPNSTIGLVLVSQKNVLIAMRETLSRILSSFSGPSNDKAYTGFYCAALINFLGTFSHKEVEPETLSELVKPFVLSASKSWIDRPIDAQRIQYNGLAGQRLVQCLPPIPIALIFITALLEQKVVFSSSRRSLLLSATVALSELLKPLQWCHLIVPRVPADLAADLLQYPAPFILGIPAEDPGMMDLIRDLPNDVTLVDLDVGRVILASSFAHDNELGRGVQNNAGTARALRSQVLFLAQSLGVAFGNAMDPLSWQSDCPSLCEPFRETATAQDLQFTALKSACNKFVNELLAGTASCCYWIQESNSENVVSEPTILFDEDRFFHVKNLRECNGFTPLFSNSGSSECELALALDDFDLILEVFLRCQCMNVHIGSQSRECMNFGW